MASGAKALSTRKKIAFATIPVCALFVVAELTLRAIGYRSPDSDPYESFVLHRPLFEKKGDALRTNRARTSYFVDQEFPRNPDPSAFRCFALGGSVTHGFLLEDPGNEAYLYRLGRRLERDLPDRRFEMINCGGLAYATYRLVGIAEECLGYDPDLLILMCGHNEFLEPRRYAELLAAPAAPQHSLRLIDLVQHLTMNRVRSTNTAPRSPEERSMVMSADHIEERYIVRDQSEIDQTVAHFSRNLRRIVGLCRERGVPVVLCVEPSNLRDWPPFETVARGKLTMVELNERLARIADLNARGENEPALKLTREVLDADPGAAMFHYAAAKCLDALGRPAEAKPEYLKARDLDAFPHRSISALNDAVREIAGSENVPLYDAEDALMEAAKDGIPGNDLFLDQCHPNAEGHRLIADGLAELIERQILKHAGDGGEPPRGE